MLPQFVDRALSGADLVTMGNLLKLQLRSPWRSLLDCGVCMEYSITMTTPLYQAI